MPDTITIPASVIGIGSDADNLNPTFIVGSKKPYKGITTVVCYAKTPPTITTRSFILASGENLTVLVSANNMWAYHNDPLWNKFEIKGITAQETTATELQITPSESSAIIVWSAVSGATTYELVVKDKLGNVICSLIFDAEGRLIQIAFGVPNRKNATQQTQTTGFSFTITGLENDTEYDMIIVAKDDKGNTLDEQKKSFKTKNTLTALDEIDESASYGVSKKILRDGQLFIIRDGKTYTVMGTEVK